MLPVVVPSMKRKGPDTWRECVVALLHLGYHKKHVSQEGAWAKKSLLSVEEVNQARESCFLERAQSPIGEGNQ